MKLIHCADLHLDSRMESNLTAEQAAARNREICATFSRTVRYGEENGVSVILIAGDLFDTQRTTARTADYFLDTVAAAEGIDFLYLRGNHDESRRVFQGRTLPGNLKGFSNKWTQYRYGSLVVSGVETDRENAGSVYDALRLREKDVNIVTMHGQESSQPGEGLVCIPRLKNRFIDYLALGHLHTYRRAALDYRGVYCYSGCLEGRGFDECGEKGFVLLETRGRSVETEFVPFAARTLYEIPVDITGLVTVTELKRALEQAAGEIPEESLVKFVLRGTSEVDTQKDFPFLLSELRSRFFFVKIKDESTLAIRGEDYRYDASLKGEFIRKVLASDYSEEERERIIRCGLGALKREELPL